MWIVRERGTDLLGGRLAHPSRQPASRLLADLPLEELLVLVRVREGEDDEKGVVRVVQHRSLYQLQSAIVRVRLHQASASTLRQVYDDASDTGLIEN